MVAKVYRGKEPHARKGKMYCLAFFVVVQAPALCPALLVVVHVQIEDNDDNLWWWQYEDFLEACCNALGLLGPQSSGIGPWLISVKWLWQVFSYQPVIAFFNVFWLAVSFRKHWAAYEKQTQNPRLWRPYTNTDSDNCFVARTLFLTKAASVSASMTLVKISKFKICSAILTLNPSEI